MAGIGGALRVMTLGLLSSVAFLACGQSAKTDGEHGTGNGGVGGAGNGGVGGATAGAGGTNAGTTAAGGSSGRPFCSATFTCTGQSVIDPYGSPSGPCYHEGEVCRGTFCNDVYSGSPFENICCSGVWTTDTNDAGVLSCPSLPEPGEPFACHANNVSCTLGETSCHHASSLGSTTVATRCDALCPASDCSCFCDPDESGNCSFREEATDGMTPFCSCGFWIPPEGSVPGTGTEVSCVLVDLPDDPVAEPCFPYPALDHLCSLGSVCLDPARPEDPNCTCYPGDTGFTTCCCLPL